MEFLSNCYSQFSLEFYRSRFMKPSAARELDDRIQFAETALNQNDLKQALQNVLAALRLLSHSAQHDLEDVLTEAASLFPKNGR